MSHVETITILDPPPTAAARTRSTVSSGNRLVELGVVDVRRERPRRGDPGLLAVRGELARRSARDPAIRDRWGQTTGIWHGTIRALLVRAGQDGSLPPSSDRDGRWRVSF